MGLQGEGGWEALTACTPPSGATLHAPSYTGAGAACTPCGAEELPSLHRLQVQTTRCKKAEELRKGIAHPCARGPTGGRRGVKLEHPVGVEQGVVADCRRGRERSVRVVGRAR